MSQFFYVYVLKSIEKNFTYIGYTSNLKRRFQEHNKGQELSTKHYSPFNLIHYEAYRDSIDAKRREGYLKTTKGKTTLRTMLKSYLSAS